MFPNPQAALPLPRRPDLEQYKKLAKELLRTVKANDPTAIHGWSENWVHGLVELSGLEIATPSSDVVDFARTRLSGDSKLSDAQFVIARCHGFPSWPKFTKHIHNSAVVDSPEAQYEA